MIEVKRVAPVSITDSVRETEVQLRVTSVSITDSVTETEVKLRVTPVSIYN